MDPLSLYSHMQLQRWGATLFANFGIVVIFVVVLRLSVLPESSGLSQIESMWGTAERDNNVWQAVVSLLYTFHRLGGNTALLCEGGSQL